MPTTNASATDNEPLERVEADEPVVGEPNNASAATQSDDNAQPVTLNSTESKQAEATKSGAADKTEAASARGRREPRAPVSQAVVPMSLHLRSRHAQRVYRRSYETAQRALYTLSVMLRIYATEAEAEQIGEVVDGMLGTVREDLAGEIARMEKVAETQGVDLGAVEYTQPQVFEVAISTPKAGQYLGLLREMDRFIALMDVLWLSGVYTDTQYNAGSYQWQRRLVKLANRLRNLAQRAMALARREDAPAGSLADLLGEEGGDEDGSRADAESNSDREGE